MMTAWARRLAWVPSPGLLMMYGIKVGQVAEHDLGVALRRQRRRLAGEPFEVAVLTHVEDGVRAELVAEPAVIGEVVVRRRQVGAVIDRHRVGAEAARRLDADEDVAEDHAGDRQPCRRSGRPSPRGMPHCSTIALRDGAGSSLNQRS